MLPHLEQEADSKENYPPQKEEELNPVVPKESKAWRPARRVTPYSTLNKEVGRRPPLKTIELHEGSAGESTEGKLSDVVDSRPQNSWVNMPSFYGHH